MKETSKTRKAIGKSEWLPFWFGQKYNKRLVSKRVRRYGKVKEDV
jgi:hypothetical protein